MTENMITHDQIMDRAVAYLRRPYARLVLPESDGTYRGEILEFPGCMATGDSPSETYLALDEAAMGWLEAALNRGQIIPEPVDASDFSGRMVLRIPRSLHKKSSRLAERDGVSLNQFITVALAEYVGDRARPMKVDFVFTSTSGIYASPVPINTQPGRNITVSSSVETVQTFGSPFSQLSMPLVNV
jgi:predicted RNase H-like HicB family nuclease